MKKKINKLITHSGRFHADDIFTCAMLQILLDAEGEEYEIIRTRDSKIIDTGDYVFDVGGVYDENKKRFDHHQEGRAGSRENGIFYSSLGLVWKKYGQTLCGSQKAADIIEKNLVEPIDAGDNGIETYNPIPNRPAPYLIQNAFTTFMPTWKEDSKLTNESFVKLSGWAKDILKREIIRANDLIEAESMVEEAYKNSPNKKILVLPERYPWEELTLKFPELLFVVVQPTSGKWKTESVFAKAASFERRAYFPKDWAGLRDEELQKVSGVSDAVFCHNGLFIAVAESKEGAIKLAQIAVES